MHAAPFHKSLKLPEPFCSLDVFSLVEAVRQTEDEIFFRQRLYIVNEYVSGGKMLLRQTSEYSVEKAWFEDCLPELTFDKER